MVITQVDPSLSDHATIITINHDDHHHPIVHDTINPHH
jgi:hypothetical protein